MNIFQCTFLFFVYLSLNGVFVQSKNFCTVKSPYKVSDPSTFPLSNASFKEPSASASQLDCSLTRISEYITKKHNCLRSKVSPTAENMLKIQWNDEAAMQAKQWADNCVYAHNSQSDRKTSQFGCGQNIAMSSPSTFALSWNAVINMWFNEVNDYVFGGVNNGDAATGHYTQIVWAKTWQVGCAWKKCQDFHFYVCNYCPAGNMQTNGETEKPYVKGNSCAACSGSCEGGKLCTNPCPYTNVYSNCDDLKTSADICTPGTPNFNMNTSCKATCLCQGKIF